MIADAQQKPILKTQTVKHEYVISLYVYPPFPEYKDIWPFRTNHMVIAESAPAALRELSQRLSGVVSYKDTAIIATIYKVGSHKDSHSYSRKQQEDVSSIGKLLRGCAETAMALWGDKI